MKTLVTGAAGFAGSHAVRHFLMNTDWFLILPVSYDHKGLPERLASAVKGYPSSRYKVVSADLSQPFSTALLEDFGQPDYIINYASQSHVDRSITDPAPFIMNNVSLVVNMLEFTRSLKELKVFVQISTDEVYGPAPQGHNHAEWEAILPSNPYSGSKAAQEAIAISYWRTYGVPLVITNTMNLVGEMQDEEKFVSKIVASVNSGSKVYVHANADGSVIGSRFYLHARNLADAVLFLIERGKPAMYEGRQEDRPDRWNIVGEREIDNLEMAKWIAELSGKPLHYELQDFHSSRPGHDLRYSLDGRKLKETGWSAPVPLEDGIKRILDWNEE
jgi:dTDP-glucose 4,6-dehydratase